jgi:hypothetical protein
MTFNHRPSRETLVACAAGILALYVSIAVRSAGFSDFNQFHAAATLVGSGELYNWEKLQTLQTGFMNQPVPYGRLPVYAALFKVLTVLPRHAAQVAWYVVNGLAMAGFVMLWPFARRDHAAIAVCWSFPVAVALAYGQDTPLFLLLIAVGLRLLSTRHDFAAGLAFSLAANKPHLAIAVPVLLIAMRRWKAIAGGLAGGALLVGASFLIEGSGWPSSLLSLTRLPEFNQAPYKMPNLNGLVYALPLSHAIEAVLAAFVLYCVYRIARRSHPAQAGAAMLAAGLLASHHAYLHDAGLLLPLTLAFAEGKNRVLAVWALVLLAPPVYQLVLYRASSAPARATIVLSAVVMLALSAWKVSGDSTQPVGACAYVGGKADSN